ncbi:hypothetical protein NQ318_012124 [Aromia moschata]|uniref:C-type lectin domain-containing protein n=1 Tax=Aromia moschata TaxID=1265417 RepID=A0AAV8YQR8_9CUCU|nr:hypothetical protein NQ318_012124 [Aromia moschata]
MLYTRAPDQEVIGILFGSDIGWYDLSRLTLPNGVENPIKSGYSDWYDIFYKSSSSIPLFTFGEKTYYIGQYFRVTFLQANLFCKLMHMHLVSIATEVENEGLENVFTQNNITGDFWSSGTRLLDGTTWMWMSTARPMTYQKWGPFEPNNKNDHCILLTKTDNDYIWNDKNCNCRYFFVCEKLLDEISMYVSKKDESEIRKFYRTCFD